MKLKNRQIKKVKNPLVVRITSWRKMAAKMAISEVATEKGFPMEIWHQIWENLDFQNRQKTCVLVSKTWKFEIRNQPKFSNEVKIKTMDHGNLLRGMSSTFHSL